MLPSFIRHHIADPQRRATHPQVTCNKDTSSAFDDTFTLVILYIFTPWNQDRAHWTLQSHQKRCLGCSSTRGQGRWDMHPRWLVDIAFKSFIHWAWRPRFCAALRSTPLKPQSVFCVFCIACGNRANFLEDYVRFFFRRISWAGLLNIICIYVINIT